MEQSKGFVESLMDLSFTSLITTKLIRFLYVLLIGLVALLSLFIMFAGFSNGFLAGMLGLVIVAPLFFVVAVIYIRVVLELIIIVFRIAEHTAELADQGRKKAMT